MERSALLAAVIALSGCGAESEAPDGGPSPVRVVATRDLGALTFPEAVKGRDGGHSARFDGRSVWAFGDTMLAWDNAAGSNWLNSTFTTTADDDPNDGLVLEEPLDATGAPSLLIPWTADEASYNASQSPPACTQDCAPKWVIWPAPLVVDPATGEALLFYMKLRDWVDAGKSIARWQSPDVPPERVEVASGSEPTLLFPEGDVEPTSAALAVGEWLYAYDCHGSCIVGRAQFTDVFERAAWNFYAGDGQWISDHRQAIGVMKTGGMASIHFNEHIDQYLAIYSGSGNRAVLRTAAAPEGPWSAELDIAALEPPQKGDFDVYDVLAHAELSLEGGRRVYLSYSRSTAPFRSEMRLVEVTLDSR